MVSAAIAAVAAVWAAWLTYRAKESATKAQQTAVILEGYDEMVRNLRLSMKGLSQELGYTRSQVASARSELQSCETRSASQAAELAQLRAELGMPPTPTS